MTGHHLLLFQPHTNSGCACLQLQALSRVSCWEFYAMLLLFARHRQHSDPNSYPLPLRRSNMFVHPRPLYTVCLTAPHIMLLLFLTGIHHGIHFTTQIPIQKWWIFSGFILTKWNFAQYCVKVGVECSLWIITGQKYTYKTIQLVLMFS